MGWHEQPSDPAVQVVVSTVPVAPAGITQAPASQTPLAQSGPVSQVVFGSGTEGMHNPPLHCPLWQSLGCVQDEPAGEPGIPPESAPAASSAPLAPAADEPPVDVDPPADREPPMDVDPPTDIEPPVDIELSPPSLAPPIPPLEL